LRTKGIDPAQAPNSVTGKNAQLPQPWAKDDPVLAHTSLPM